ncbi:MAG TPA: phosphate signaling complex protein PhoU [Acidobacteriota bacterium]|nr:phosphate signaling complex protein PhoU [Acidobacteriota bacterium]HNT17665.1 phosphate signaling complex protein PhoU [Acidobacteriota bacterium]HPA27066.1 phosphate signaling complex protein PhoU [Acidobacteriota bacterium]HQO20436.1 phosphate signaling complex protein PhoU [Acidobacteriota bacterium]HQQ47248.1 phosphate signaling complex protein PhoU [Acidobacteriota bacterium]
MREREEIRKLMESIVTMADEVNAVLVEALGAIKGGAEDILKKLDEKDHLIDRMENENDSKCLRILALYQPEADDLRTVTMAMKMNNDIERIGDHAINIAERAVTIKANLPETISMKIEQMGGITKTMFSDVITAFIAKDTALAKSVIAKDDQIDALLKEIINLALWGDEAKAMEREKALAVTSTARELERIADLATNICEDIVFMAEGVTLRHGGGK